MSVTPRAPRHTIRPQRLLRAAPGSYIAMTLFVAWLMNLLPWERWPGVPDLFALALIFWSLHAPRRVGLLVAFLGGLLLDTHSARLLGEHALAYSVMVYCAIMLRGRILRFGWLGQTLHILPILMLAQGVVYAMRGMLTGDWPNWWWMADGLVSAAMWPLASWLLQLPQSRRGDQT